MGTLVVTVLEVSQREEVVVTLWVGAGTEFSDLGRGGGAKLLTCPYPLNVQARPPRDQRPAFRSRISLSDCHGMSLRFNVHIQSKLL